MTLSIHELSPQRSTDPLRILRQQAPLVHCLTNDVVQNFTANCLLAIGAAPAMVTEPEEAAQFSAIADALLINIGTLTRSRSRAMLAAIESANQAGTPWVLDPVGVGALHYRTDFARQLLALAPAAIRANASEILALAGHSGAGRGVDSADNAYQVLPVAIGLASRWHTLVAVTGAVDFITDGEQVWSVDDGHPLMTRVTGTGCALSAVVAAFCALPGDRLVHVAAACKLMASSGRQAAVHCAGPGSFVAGFIDELYLQCAGASV